MILIPLFLSFAVHAAVDLPATPGDRDFLAKVSSLDLNSSSVQLEYKDSGTSLGLKIKVNGSKGGKWAPENSANHVEGQVVTYNMSRFLNMSDMVVPSAYYRLKDPALAKFKNMLASARETNKWRKINRVDILKAISQSPNGLLGVYTEGLPGGSIEVKSLKHPGAETINPSHPVARFIRADGPKPSNNFMKLAEVKARGGGQAPHETELELARQFSKIMVLDMLMGQWDRFSGGNVEASVSGSKVFFISRDNGGSTVQGTANLAKYYRIVTRFDREQVEMIRTLAAQLSSPATAPELLKVLQVRSSRHSLVERAKLILTHVQAQVRAHGEKAYFQ